MRTINRFGVDISPFPAFRERYPNGVPLRPPMAPRPPRAPLEPVEWEPEPVPASAPTVVIPDPATVAVQIRAWFSGGRSPRRIAAELERLNVPNDRGGKWYASSVRRALMACAPV
jgi:hypothetical protein